MTIRTNEKKESVAPEIDLAFRGKLVSLLGVGGPTPAESVPEALDRDKSFYRKSLSTVSLLRDFVDRLKEPVYWLFILFKYM